LELLRSDREDSLIRRLDGSFDFRSSQLPGDLSSGIRDAILLDDVRRTLGSRRDTDGPDLRDSSPHIGDSSAADRRSRERDRDARRVPDHHGSKDSHRGPELPSSNADRRPELLSDDANRSSGTKFHDSEHRSKVQDRSSVHRPEMDRGSCRGPEMDRNSDLRPDIDRNSDRRPDMDRNSERRPDTDRSSGHIPDMDRVSERRPDMDRNADLSRTSDTDRVGLRRDYSNSRVFGRASCEDDCSRNRSDRDSMDGHRRDRSRSSSRQPSPR
jgi:hypothetical protein